MKLKQAKRFIAKQRKARRDAVESLKVLLSSLPKEPDTVVR